MTNVCYSSLLLLALCSLSLHIGVHAFSIKVPGLNALYKFTRPDLGCAVDAATDDMLPSEMQLELDGEKAVRKYPKFPHPPLLVAAGTCNAVVLRWRSFETLLWPVERFVLQRYPDRENQPRWSTLLDENTLELVDFDVHSGCRYTYRVQAICKDNATSAYEYQQTQVDGAVSGSSTVCRSSSALLGSVGALNAEGLRSLGLIFACFLTVYGLVRASVMGVQGTQSRNCRLKRIRNSTSEGRNITVSMSERQRLSTTLRRSLSSTSSSSLSMDGNSGKRSSIPSAASVSIAATTSDPTRARRSMDTVLRQESAQSSIASSFRPISRSIGAIDEKVTGCEHCGKHFGLFRKQYICDICHSVSLCRKCGYQASVDSFANARSSLDNTRVSTGNRGMSRRRSSLSQHRQKKLKIRTICRNCCDYMYRYSTHPNVRPSYAPAEG